VVIEDFETLLLSGTPLIDTRAPLEFAKGSLPTAVNLPLMTDAEREQVGKCYKEKGQDAAIELGHALVSGETKQQRVDAWQAFVSDHPNAVLFCFRGGLRSQISQQWLSEAGTVIPRIEGGYKALRSWLIDKVDACATQQPLLVIGGRTGCAKTELLTHGCSGNPIPNSIDLEGLANHRGSAFGKRAGGQPSQISFELALGVALLQVLGRQPDCLVLEDEGRLIGRCAIPLSLHTAMKKAPLMLLESTFEDRVEHSFHNYILANLAEIEARIQDQEQAFEIFAEGLQTSLMNIAKRLGGVRYQALNKAMTAALFQHREKHDPELHREWIAPLLRDYYDPMYDYQLKDRRHLICAQGTAAELAERLCHPPPISDEKR
jgi:tRNA 2-selenouridine synthase